VPLEDLLDEIHEQTRGLILKKDIKLTWQEIDLAREVIPVDREKLYRAIMNVIGNAVEFTPPHGTIVVTVTKKDSELILTIRDGGKGFGAMALRHGKEQFFMSDSSRTDHKHHGMGLYIADNIVKQHGGQLVIGNTAQGGLVTITLQER
jgi:signal transduction histidine kinase